MGAELLTKVHKGGWSSPWLLTTITLSSSGEASILQFEEPLLLFSSNLKSSMVAEVLTNFWRLFSRPSLFKDWSWLEELRALQRRSLSQEEAHEAATKAPASAIAAVAFFPDFPLKKEFSEDKLEVELEVTTADEPPEAELSRDWRRRLIELLLRRRAVKSFQRWTFFNAI